MKKKQTAKKKPKKQKESMDDFYDKWDAWGRKKSAWTQYVSYMHNYKMENDREYREAQAKKPNLIYIG